MSMALVHTTTVTAPVSVSPRTTPRPPGHTRGTPQPAMAAGGGCARPSTTTRASRAASTTVATPTATTLSTSAMGALFRLCQFH